MHGDISRFLFDSRKQYSRVCEQQGRTRVDADGNENTEILVYDARQARIDIIGRHGAPADNAGLEIVSTGASLTISPGRYYVDGIRCDHEALGPVDFDDQPHLPGTALPTAPGLYLIYLDCWERPINAVADPEIREVALGGADTTTRTKVVWQVKALPVTTTDPTPSCATEFIEWDELIAGPSGTLQIKVADAGATTDPCIVPETAGFTGLENQLYRFQIHDGNFDPTLPGGSDPGISPTFKWSRDNASTVAAWRDHTSSLLLTVDRLGPGGANGLTVGDWLELTNDDDDLLHRPGLLGQIGDIVGDTVLLDDPSATLTPALSPVPKSDATKHSQVRRWESPNGKRTTALAVADPDEAPGGWMRIGTEGILAKFDAGTFQSGDHWIVPARTAILPGTEDARLDWPTDGSGNPLAIRAQGTVHHYARLAIAELAGGTWTVIDDCRHLFEPLTDLVQMDARGGDGQHTRGEHWLPAPIRVGVSRGETPIANAKVRLTLVPVDGWAIGRLSDAAPDEDGNATSTQLPLDVVTDADGIARGWWRLAMPPASEEHGDIFQPAAGQVVEATLLDGEDNPTNLSTRFVAQAFDNVTLTPAGGDGQQGKPGETLEFALRVRIANGGRPVSGAHVLFRHLNNADHGQPLNEFSGGAIHASLPTSPPNPGDMHLISWKPWPGGSRMQEAVVATNDEGVAQVQHILGQDTGLPIQRVQAILLDHASEETSQMTFFVAHLALAEEIAWTPCKSLQPYLKGEEDYDVQGALDALCTARVELEQWQAWVIEKLAELQTALDDGGSDGGGRTIFIPNFDDIAVLREYLRNPGRRFPALERRGPITPRPVDPTPDRPVRPGEPSGGGIEIRTRGGGPISLQPGVEVEVGEFTGVELRMSTPFPESIPDHRANAAVAVYADQPIVEDGEVRGFSPMRLSGTVRFSGQGDDQRARWEPSPAARSWLTKRLRADGTPVALEFAFEPAVLGQRSDDKTAHRERFFVTR